ncbi:hypothetical protein GQ457_03G011910 [Hibiscus cannabinus]
MTTISTYITLCPTSYSLTIENHGGLHLSSLNTMVKMGKVPFPFDFSLLVFTGCGMMYLLELNHKLI